MGSLRASSSSELSPNMSMENAGKKLIPNVVIVEGITVRDMEGAR